MNRDAGILKRVIQGTQARDLGGRVAVGERQMDPEEVEGWQSEGGSQSGSLPRCDEEGLCASGFSETLQKGVDLVDKEGAGARASRGRGFLGGGEGEREEKRQEARETAAKGGAEREEEVLEQGERGDLAGGRGDGDEGEEVGEGEGDVGHQAAVSDALENGREGLQRQLMERGAELRLQRCEQAPGQMVLERQGGVRLVPLYDAEQIVHDLHQLPLT